MSGERRPLSFYLAAALMVALVLSIVLALRFRADRKAAHAQLERFEEYCGVVRHSIRQDWQDLEDPKHQGQAADRFYFGIQGHSAVEILLCADSKELPDFSRHTLCWMGKDYACLAELAKAAERAIPYGR